MREIVSISNIVGFPVVGNAGQVCVVKNIYKGTIFSDVIEAPCYIVDIG